MPARISAVTSTLVKPSSLFTSAVASLTPNIFSRVFTNEFEAGGRMFEFVDLCGSGNPARILLSGHRIPVEVLAGPMSGVMDFLNESEEGSLVRQCLLTEPRGYPPQVMAVIIPKFDGPGNGKITCIEDVRGFIIVLQTGFVPMCGHVSICVGYILHVLFAKNRQEPAEYELEVACGKVNIFVNGNESTLVNVPCFALHDHLKVKLSNGLVADVSICFSGLYFLIVNNAEELGKGLVAPDNATSMISLGNEIKKLANEQLKHLIHHPSTPDLPHSLDVALLRSKSRKDTSAVIVPGNYCDRSPCGTGTSAVLALKYFRGEIKNLDDKFKHHSIIGTEFLASVFSEEKLSVGGTGGVPSRVYRGIRPRITGHCWITGAGFFFAGSKHDLMPKGVVVSDLWGDYKGQDQEILDPHSLCTRSLGLPVASGRDCCGEETDSPKDGVRGIDDIY